MQDEHKMDAAPKSSILTKEKAAVLLVDHQSGRLSLVQDFPPDEFRKNVLALADVAKLFSLPTILTTSFDSGPNGPILPELKEIFPTAPPIARPGQVNAWDNEEFVRAVETGRKQLILAGVVTDVCVAFPALSALRLAKRSLRSPMLQGLSTRQSGMQHGIEGQVREPT